MCDSHPVCDRVRDSREMSPGRGCRGQSPPGAGSCQAEGAAPLPPDNAPGARGLFPSWHRIKQGRARPGAAAPPGSGEALLGLKIRLGTRGSCGAPSKLSPPSPEVVPLWDNPAESVPPGVNPAPKPASPGSGRAFSSIYGTFVGFLGGCASLFWGIPQRICPTDRPLRFVDFGALLQHPG